VPVAFLPDPWAALPGYTYFFRDISLGFIPWRLFQARELAEGRVPFWNPYVHEGEFMLPSFYPLDLLHVLAPTPAFISWLLALHLPLAALSAFALARTRGISRAGAFATGVVYSLGGFALSTLNLYIFLQALALAPFIVLALDRAATAGGRWTAAAALVVALAISTMGVEIAMQAVALGAVLALWRDAQARAMRAEIGRLLVAVLLGVGVAGVPVFITLGMLPETARGGGLAASDAAALALHPMALFQIVMADFFGPLAAPLEWWGNRFFPGGFPYFVSIYLGVLVLALAAIGLRQAPRRERLVLACTALLALWYALGEAGGLWGVLQFVPGAGGFRTPSKSMFTFHLAAALLAGRGIDRLCAGMGWRALGIATAAAACALATLALVANVAGAAAAAWLMLDSGAQEQFSQRFPRETLHTALPLVLAALVALAVLRERLRRSFSAAILIGLLIFDLTRAGAGINKQVPQFFFGLLPEVAAERLDQLNGARTFVYSGLFSPAFLAWARMHQADADMWIFYASRQAHEPYANLIDRVETVGSFDRTQMTPALTELARELQDPRHVAQLVPRLRQVAVSRVVSFDPLEHPDLRLRRSAQIGFTGLNVRIYELASPWARAFVACRGWGVENRFDAVERAQAAAFDPSRDVALETGRSQAPREAGCVEARASMAPLRAGEERFVVDSDGPGWLVSRATHARGWHAEIDGIPVPVLRADGRHRAVAIPSGHHQVIMRYDPPGLRIGLALSALCALVLAWLALRRKAVNSDTQS
jgi:hypothetical protein